MQDVITEYRSALKENTLVVLRGGFGDFEEREQF
jgi:hypothetical protein